MGTKQKRRVVLTDYKAKAKDRYVDIEGNEGRVYSAPPPELWPDKVFALLASENLVGAAQVVLGVDDYDRFVEDGGSASMLFSILKDDQGDDLGE